MTDASMVIVGGGKAGARAAVAFRENAWKGPVTLISDEALAPYDRPPLSKAAIMEEAEPQPAYLLDEGMMASLEVNFLRGNAATAIDRNAKTVSLADGKKIPYDRLLDCNGSGAPAAFASGCRARPSAARSRRFRKDTIRIHRREKRCHHRRRIYRAGTCRKCRQARLPRYSD